ncbi:MAG: UDP-N-acetylglucosamine 2-epimerase (non-hydrolyzing) [Gemmatimonadota bacterium]
MLAVVGTRPEAIKMAPVLHALHNGGGTLECRLALTGQHSTLVDRVLDVFALEPAYDLGIMREGQTLYDVAEGCMEGLRGAVRDFRPDLLLVQGDTATVFFASLVAFFEKVRVGHVEAGLRSGDKWSPYPEEIFRRLADVLSDLYFAPTPTARENLLREGVSPERIFVTGNTVVDALHAIAAQQREPENAVLREVLASGDRLVLLTAHRRESFGEPLREVFRAVCELADRAAPDAGGRGLRILYPVHPNPRVSGPAHELLAGHSRIHLVEPLDYFDLVAALRHAALVLTDSGGIQEEAPTFGAPVLVLRDVTERPEGVAAGVAALVGTDSETIVRESLRLLEHAASGQGRAPRNPYGDGRAGERIADIIRVALVGGKRRTTDWKGPDDRAGGQAEKAGG